MTGIESAGWWTTFFEGPALELWRRAYASDESRAQAADAARALRLRPGERVLDVPCGNGRLALELAARGARVSGLDACAEFVAEGRRKARERGLELELVTGDMRSLTWSAEYDAALCAGNSFGYFDEDGNRDFLRGVARALRPGGRFLLEAPLVAELVLARSAYRDWRILGERLLLSEARFDEQSARLETTYTFADLGAGSGALESRTASYRVYGTHEIVAALREAGFTTVERLGDLEGNPFARDSVEFFALATR